MKYPLTVSQFRGQGLGFAYIEPANDRPTQISRREFCGDPFSDLTVTAGNQDVAAREDCIASLIVHLRLGRSLPAKEFDNTTVTLTAMAIMAHTGLTSPVIEASTPMPLKLSARDTLVKVSR